MQKPLIKNCQGVKLIVCRRDKGGDSYLNLNDRSQSNVGTIRRKYPAATQLMFGGNGLSGTSPLLPVLHKSGRTGLVREDVGAGTGLVSAKMMSINPTPSGTSPLLPIRTSPVGPDLSGKEVGADVGLSQAK